MTLFDKINKIRCGGNVSRFHTIPTIRTQSVAAHSWGVAVLCCQLWPKDSDLRSLLKAALFHDCAEYITGDIPAPIKESVGSLKSSIKEIESKYYMSLGVADPVSTLHSDALPKLKFADNLEGALYCLEELKMGNKMMSKPFSRYISYLEKVHSEIPEPDKVNWVIEELTKEAAKL